MQGEKIVQADSQDDSKRKQHIKSRQLSLDKWGHYVVQAWKELSFLVLKVDSGVIAASVAHLPLVAAPQGLPRRGGEGRSRAPSVLFFPAIFSPVGGQRRAIASDSAIRAFQTDLFLSLPQWPVVGRATLKNWQLPILSVQPSS